MAILKSSENKEAAYAFIDTILDPRTTPGRSENILYNVPNEAAMQPAPREARPSQYATLGARREEMLQGENMVDIGEASTLYNRIITEVTASDRVTSGYGGAARARSPSRRCC